jgi:hypothetical protein
MSYVKLHYANVDEIGVIPSYVDISTLYNADKAKAAYCLRGIIRDRHHQPRIRLSPRRVARCEAAG